MTMQLMMMLNLLFFFSAPKNEVPKSIYDFKVEAVDGKTIDFAKYKGKKIMIVNTASQCGNTPQYADLQKLHLKYQDKLVIIGFPANNFGAQEPGTDAEIAEFCSTKFDVKFPMFSKISVVGDDKHPLYSALTAAAPRAEGDPDAFRDRLKGFGMTPNQDPDVLWNFEKFLVNRQGEVVKRFAPTTTPDDAALTAAIEAELAK